MSCNYCEYGGTHWTTSDLQDVADEHGLDLPVEELHRIMVRLHRPLVDEAVRGGWAVLHDAIARYKEGGMEAL